MNNHSYLGHFAGRRILIVEDEYFLADETRRTLTGLNAHVVGPAASVMKAMELIEGERIDAAILDVYLDGEFVFPVAEKLEELGIPYVFATGYDPSVISERFQGFTLSEKPIDLNEIAKALFEPPPAA